MGGKHPPHSPLLSPKYVTECIYCIVQETYGTHCELVRARVRDRDRDGGNNKVEIEFGLRF